MPRYALIVIDVQNDYFPGGRCGMSAIGPGEPFHRLVRKSGVGDAPARTLWE